MRLPARIVTFNVGRRHRRRRAQHTRRDVSDDAIGG